MRRQAREVVFQYIFSKLFNFNDEGLFDVLIKDFNDDDRDFSKKLLNFVENDREKNLSLIGQLSIGFKLDRLLNTDKCALLIGMAELDNFPDTPIAVVIDEAVSLSAKFSTEKSTDFVNGVLSKYVRSKNND